VAAVSRGAMFGDASLQAPENGGVTGGVG
jgi:hypothetical protein